MSKIEKSTINNNKDNCMPFLDWVNKSQAVGSAADVPYHLLLFVSAHGDGGTDSDMIPTTQPKG